MTLLNLLKSASHAVGLELHASSYTRLEEEIGFLEQRLEQSVLEGRRGSRDVEVVEDRVLESEVRSILSQVR